MFYLKLNLFTINAGRRFDWSPKRVRNVTSCLAQEIANQQPRWSLTIWGALYPRKGGVGVPCRLYSEMIPDFRGLEMHIIVFF